MGFFASRQRFLNLITGLPLKSEPVQENGLVKPSILVWLGGYINEEHSECQDILSLGKSPIKWEQCPDLTIAVGWEVKHQFKQTNYLTPRSRLSSE